MCFANLCQCEIAALVLPALSFTVAIVGNLLIWRCICHHHRLLVPARWDWSIHPGQYLYLLRVTRTHCETDGFTKTLHAPRRGHQALVEVGVQVYRGMASMKIRHGTGPRFICQVDFNCDWPGQRGQAGTHDMKT